jgi:RNA polymerase sigma-70 factor (ECF subfamily)
MNRAPATDLTSLLRAWSAGDEEALEQLTPLVYGQLHGLAQRYMARESPGHVLQSTALINEAYLRLSNLKGIDWQDRSHFFTTCARLMRRILTDYARSRLYLKREGNVPHVPWTDRTAGAERPVADLVALDHALDALAALDARKSHVVQLRFFAGLSLDETARALGVSRDTVKRDWIFAKHWLLRELGRGPDRGN